ncbi:DUF4982 domain-containing protein [Actinomyces ruminis]|uniref:DUF4982 domain-containing protein n=1 Tax=Actinomyces ruminis TaxID=1937003 RepID=UPI00211E8B61|nr:DUF4982 domain-containing protein [Actinomyces ruminis]
MLYSLGNEIPETAKADGILQARALAERVRSLDPTRPTTIALNAFLSVLEDVAVSFAERIAAAGSPEAAANEIAEENGGAQGGVNTAGGMMDVIAGSPATQERVREVLSIVDVGGVNYAESLYDSEHLTGEGLILVGSETFAGRVGHAWPAIADNPRVLGDFTWTGWDYLGEVGIGAIHYAYEGHYTLEAAYPWRFAFCGDLDTTGERRPQSFYREIAFGLRHSPYLAVERPEAFGRVLAARQGQWCWPEVEHAWDLDAEVGTKLNVDVYSDAEEVELFVNGHSVGRARVGEEEPFRARIAVEWQPGELLAVAYADGEETGRDVLATPGSPERVEVRVERDRVAPVPTPPFSPRSPSPMRPVRASIGQIRK